MFFGLWQEKWYKEKRKSKLIQYDQTEAIILTVFVMLQLCELWKLEIFHTNTNSDYLKECWSLSLVIITQGWEMNSINTYAVRNSIMRKSVKIFNELPEYLKKKIIQLSWFKTKFNLIIINRNIIEFNDYSDSDGILMLSSISVNEFYCFAFCCCYYVFFFVFTWYILCILNLYQNDINITYRFTLPNSFLRMSQKKFLHSCGLLYSLKEEPCHLVNYLNEMFNFN